MRETVRKNRTVVHGIFGEVGGRFQDQTREAFKRQALGKFSVVRCFYDFGGMASPDELHFGSSIRLLRNCNAKYRVQKSIIIMKFSLCTKCCMQKHQDNIDAFRASRHQCFE